MQSRKEFIKNASALLLAQKFSFGPDMEKRKSKLAFSTLGCPDWPLQKIIPFAKRYGYSALEMRGVMRNMDLPTAPGFNSPSAIGGTLRMMQDSGLRFADLASSATLHYPDGSLRNRNIDEGKKYIDLAHALDCPFVRVFPNNFDAAVPKQKTIELIGSALGILGGHASGSGVRVLMETHGDLVYADDLAAVMNQANNPNTGLIWDYTNMWLKTRLPPDEIWKTISGYVYHAHVKDGVLKNNDLHYVYFGQGEVPIVPAIKEMMQSGYQGYYSFEWEKLWHPDIAEPEFALADFPQAFHKIFR